MKAAAWWTRRERRAWRRRLVSAVVSRFAVQPTHKKIADDPHRIVIIRPNHRLGNILMLTPLVAAVTARWPHAKIDLIAAGRVQAIFQSFTSIDKCLDVPEPILKLPIARSFRRAVRHRYDLAINVDPSSQSGHLIARIVDAPITVMPQARDDAHMALAPLGALNTHLTTPLPKPFPRMSLRLSQVEKAQGHSALMTALQLNEPPPQIIGLYPFANKGRDYPVEWWQTLITALRQTVSDAFLVEILPAHGQALLESADASFLTLELRDFAAQLSALDAVIATDGGVMHLASAADTLTYGLFKVTAPEVYKPFGGNNRGWAFSQAHPRAIADALSVDLNAQ